ncbi:TPA: RND transporter, partial [Burkholderia territorii]|nr:RND transporter [Burkholderia territorii]HDR8873103.1 RND transporter [Burkholderia territorii]
YRNARLDEIRATGARLADTARLYQAMGTPPPAPAGNAATPANADTAAHTDSAEQRAAMQARAATSDAPPSSQ